MISKCKILRLRRSSIFNSFIWIEIGTKMRHILGNEKDVPLGINKIQPVFIDVWFQNAKFCARGQLRQCESHVIDIAVHIQDRYLCLVNERDWNVTKKIRVVSMVQWFQSAKCRACSATSLVQQHWDPSERLKVLEATWPKWIKNKPSNKNKNINLVAWKSGMLSRPDLGTAPAPGNYPGSSSGSGSSKSSDGWAPDQRKLYRLWWLPLRLRLRSSESWPNTYGRTWKSIRYTVLQRLRLREKCAGSDGSGSSCGSASMLKMKWPKSTENVENRGRLGPSNKNFCTPKRVAGSTSGHTSPSIS